MSWAGNAGEFCTSTKLMLYSVVDDPLWLQCQILSTVNQCQTGENTVILYGQRPPGRNQELKEQLLEGSVPL